MQTEKNGGMDKLRCGYTTGTCAAAAAGAAIRLLLTGKAPEQAAFFVPAGQQVFLDIEEAFREGEAAVCGVRKDAGDDPDVTNRTMIYARVSRGNPGDFIWYEKRNSDGESGALHLTGGAGVGTVTKRGLACPVGYPAINPVPREMIFAEAERARGECGEEEQELWIVVSIPEGEQLAARTFNPNLGIVGGISVLGTSGIVRPMSEDALRETIRLEIRVRAAEGRTLLAAAPGNYGEAFLREETGLSMDAFVKCSNYIGETLCMMAQEGVRGVLLAGHLGKLIKVAGGVLNTHSRYGDRRMEILSDCIGRAAGDSEAERAVLAMNTTEEAADYLKGRGILKPVMEEAAFRVKRVLERESGLAVEVLLFSSVLGLLAKTDGADEFAARLGGRGASDKETGRT